MAERSLMASGMVLALLLAGCGANSPVANKAEAKVPTAMPSAVASPTAAPVPGATVDAGNLSAFWDQFRQAALAGDAARIQSLSAAIVEQHGTLDDDPVVKLRGPAIARAVVKVLANPEEVDATGKSLRAIMESGAAPVPDPQQPPTYYRIGNLVFEKGAKGWQLTQLYVEADG